jgi:ribosomal protein S18 acetylase RimI-like enzyme
LCCKECYRARVNPSLRPIQPSDLPAIHRLQRRIEQLDGIPVATPLEEFEGWLTEPHLALEADTRLAEVAGEPVGWGRIWHQPSGEREERAYMLGAVDPASRGKGIGSALLRWQLARATELLEQASAHLPRFARAQVYDFQEPALRLFERHGLRPIRYIDELLRELGSVPTPQRIEGIEIVPWDAARSEEARAVLNAGFADHWGWTPRDPAHWEHEIASFGSRLDLSFLALDDGRVVGMCRNGHFPGDEAVNGRRDGWVMQVSVIRSHRDRGIASALIIASLAAFRDAGLTHSALGVDSDNPTGAYQLYERLGYRRKHRLVVYQVTI